MRGVVAGHKTGHLAALLLFFLRRQAQRALDGAQAARRHPRPLLGFCLLPLEPLLLVPLGLEAVPHVHVVDRKVVPLVLKRRLVEHEPRALAPSLFRQLQRLESPTPVARETRYHKRFPARPVVAQRLVRELRRVGVQQKWVQRSVPQVHVAAERAVAVLGRALPLGSELQPKVHVASKPHVHGKRARPPLGFTAEAQGPLTRPAPALVRGPRVGGVVPQGRAVKPLRKS
mmetsp:Transcript_2532/g.5345  ORF Transcript_2532/g.5345 Transcript_2532/m.5345 type:complete len:230 (-) Transcript_2532:367-1056(-)